jgi:hypothetical protein
MAQLTIARRTCLRCGSPADCASWLSQTYDGMPSGREYEFKCGACGHTFRVLGGGQLFWSAFVVAAFALVGFANLKEGLHLAWRQSFGLGVVCAVAAAVAALQLGWRLHVRASAAELPDEP